MVRAHPATKYDAAGSWKMVVWNEDLPGFEVYQILMNGVYCHFKFPKL
jgi:hypothetical protein